MKKLFALVILSCVLSYLCVQIYHKIEAKKIFDQHINHLPSPSTFQWVSKQPLTSKTPTIVLFFNSDCEHCQLEAKTIVEQKNKFIGVNFWWTSVEDATTIKAFSKRYSLYNVPNTHLSHLPTEKLLQIFGSISAPHIFIYDKNKILKKEFKGETKIEAILKYVKTN
jgi:thiol-disulfide isomerase/thioredoxin